MVGAKKELKGKKHPVSRRRETGKKRAVGKRDRKRVATLGVRNVERALGEWRLFLPW